MLNTVYPYREEEAVKRVSKPVTFRKRNWVCTTVLLLTSDVIFSFITCKMGLWSAPPNAGVS